MAVPKAAIIFCVQRQWTESDLRFSALLKDTKPSILNIVIMGRFSKREIRRNVYNLKQKIQLNVLF